jgi:hypothetical protein
LIKSCEPERQATGAALVDGQSSRSRLGDGEGVAVGVAEGEHRWYAGPLKDLIGIDAGGVESRVGCRCVVGGEPDSDGAAGDVCGGLLQRDDDVVAAGCELDPPSGRDRLVAQYREAERVDVEPQCLFLVVYISEPPGVVSSRPVSSQVLSPERIIGQPPYRCASESAASWSCRRKGDLDQPLLLPVSSQRRQTPSGGRRWRDRSSMHRRGVSERCVQLTDEFSDPPTARRGCRVAP